MKCRAVPRLVLLIGVLCLASCTAGSSKPEPSFIPDPPKREGSFAATGNTDPSRRGVPS